MTTPSDRFADLAPDRTPTEGRTRSFSDRMPERRPRTFSDRTKQHSFEDRAPQRKGSKEGKSVAELMRQRDEASSDSEDKKGGGGRARDEVFSEIIAVLKTNSIIQLADFDYRIRQHLHAMLGSGGRQKLHDALKAINDATAKKTRNDVKNWPAYLRKLLTKFEEDRASKDREARAQARVEQAAVETAAVGDKEAALEEFFSDQEDEEEAWLQVLDQDLSEKDKWLNSVAVDVQQSTSKPPPPTEAPPPPPTEAPPPPPKELAASMKQQAAMSSEPQGALAKDVRPIFPAPTKPPMQKACSQAPPMPPPALPPSMMGQKPAEGKQMQMLSKPPMEPPRVSPESYLKKTSAQTPACPTLLQNQVQSLHRQFQQQQPFDASLVAECISNQKDDSSTSLDFPLEAWAAWLTPSPLHVAAN